MNLAVSLKHGESLESSGELKTKYMGPLQHWLSWAGLCPTVVGSVSSSGESDVQPTLESVVCEKAPSRFQPQLSIGITWGAYSTLTAGSYPQRF